MKLISSLLIGLGFLLTLLSNVLAYNALAVAFRGVRNGDGGASGIAGIARSMDSAYFWNFIGIIGCALLGVGITLALLLRMKKEPFEIA